VRELESLQAKKQSGLLLLLRRRLPTRLQEIGLRLTTRWSRPGQPGRLRLRDTRPRLAGRLISRPFGVPDGFKLKLPPKSFPCNALPARGGCRWLEPAASAPISTKVACQGSVTLLLHEVFRPISKMARPPSAGDLAFEVLGSAAEQLAEADPACRVSFSAHP